MRTQMVIRIKINSQKDYSNAIKVAAAVKGVHSVTITGEEKNLLLVIGVGIDSNRITEKLRRKVGPAEVVELRTIEHDGSNHPVHHHHHPYRYHQSQVPIPYKHEAARDLHYYTAGYQNSASAGSYGHDYYRHGGGGGYQGQHDYFYPPPGNTHTVVHHGHNSYSDDSCSIM